MQVLDTWGPHNDRLEEARKRYYEIIETDNFVRYAVCGRQGDWEVPPSAEELSAARNLLKNPPLHAVLTPKEFCVDYGIPAFDETDWDIYGYSHPYLQHGGLDNKIYVNALYVSEDGSAPLAITLLLITLLHETFHWAVARLGGTLPAHPFTTDDKESGYWFEKKALGGRLIVNKEFKRGTGSYSGVDVLEVKSLALRTEDGTDHGLTEAWYHLLMTATEPFPLDLPPPQYRSVQVQPPLTPPRMRDDAICPRCIPKPSNRPMRHTTESSSSGGCGKKW